MTDIDPNESDGSLDAHVRSMVSWHFSEETGTPYWLDWAKTTGWNPVEEIQSFADMVRFPEFDGDLLRTEPHGRWVPRAYAGRPFSIFETGGTTGMPQQRISWDDYKIAYEQFSETLDESAFPPGGYWLMIGPTGPRRLRLAIEHLANHRGSSCYFVDLDPRWVKRMIRDKQFDHAKAYMRHVIDQAVTIIEKREVSVLFTTPKLHCFSMALFSPPSGPLFRLVTMRMNPVSPQNVPQLFRRCQYSLPCPSTPHPVSDTTWSMSSTLLFLLAYTPPV